MRRYAGIDMKAAISGREAVVVLIAPHTANVGTLLVAVEGEALQYFCDYQPGGARSDDANVRAAPMTASPIGYAVQILPPRCAGHTCRLAILPPWLITKQL